MRYTRLEGIILKKQNYKEADQIVTIWTREAGKIRFLARGVRLAKSKLNYSLQDLSWVAVELTGRNLPTLVGASCLKQHQNLSQDLKKAAIAFYAAELMLKITADEHPNEPAFEILKEFLSCLDRLDYSIRYYPLLESFSLKLLDALGFSIKHARRSFQIPSELDSHLQDLSDTEFAEFERLDIQLDLTDQLHHLINRFIEFILERHIKSEPFLISI